MPPDGKLVQPACFQSWEKILSETQRDRLPGCESRFIHRPDMTIQRNGMPPARSASGGMGRTMKK
jgi:hypothetical protein